MASSGSPRRPRKAASETARKVPSSKPTTKRASRPRLTIFFSRSHKDRDLLDELIAHLKPLDASGTYRHAFEFWDDRDIPAGDRWEDRLREAWESVDAAVFLVSEDSLRSQIIMTWEIPSLRARQGRDGMPLIPVLAGPCDWEAVDWLRAIQLTPRDRRPLSTLSGDERMASLAAVATDILNAVDRAGRRPRARAAKPEATTGAPPPASSGPTGESGSSGRAGNAGLVPIDRLEAFQLSGQASLIVRDRALKLARSAGPIPIPLTSSVLLFAVLEGRGEGLPSETVRHFAKAFDHLPDRRLAEARSAYFHGAAHEYRRLAGSAGGTTIWMTSNVEAMLRTARDIARDVSGTEMIHARHLLAALAIHCGDESFGARLRLGELGLDSDDLRRKYYDSVVLLDTDEDHAAWSRFLLGAPPAPRPPTMPATSSEGEPPATHETPAGPSPDGGAGGEAESGPRSNVPRFDADAWDGPNLLGTEGEVEALASLVAAWSVEPPLSIGLFGDWGTGKTFFMRQMMDRVEAISRAARRDPRPQSRIGYYKNIVQIEFNAWHYIEGNLWASLVEHIFANLRLEKDEDEGRAAERRRRLLDQLELQKEFQERAGQQIRALQAQEDEARRRADAARAGREGLLDEIVRLAKDSWSEASKTIDVRDLSDDVRRGLGLPAASDTLPTDDVRRAVESARGLWGRVRTLWKLVLSEPQGHRIIVRVLAAVIVGALLCGVAQWLIGPSLRQTYLLAIQALAALAPFAALVGERLAWVSGQLRPLEEKIRAEAADARAARDQKVAALQREVDQLGRQRVEAEQEQAKAQERINALNRELEETTPGGMLIKFIEDRAGSTDYRRHLGVLAVIRRDFEKLARLIADRRREEEGGTGPGDTDAINRIILYIDDLDRCPPGRVVEVLQAIHLLLAFPLFVVVVGVDARWVERSLERRFEWLRQVDGEEEGAGGGPRDGRPGATAHDYLEKIFQIPFWLRPMDESAYQSLVEGLTRPIPELAPRAEAEVGRVVERGPGADDQPPGGADTAPPTPVGDAHPEGAEHKAQGPDDLMQGGPTGGVSGGRPIANPPEPAHEDERDKDEDGGGAEIDLTPRSLELEGREREFLRTLAPVVGRSPRAVKRFINCYRLIKVGLSPGELERFVAPADQGDWAEYEAVMVALGVVAGAPEVARALLPALAEGREGEDLPGLIERLDADPDLAARPEWARLRAFLRALLARRKPVARLAPLASAARRVARYSFRPALAEPPPRPMPPGPSPKPRGGPEAIGIPPIVATPA